MAAKRKPARRRPDTAHQQSTQGYRWIDKDPVIDEVLYLCRQDGRSLSAIANAAWLSPTTLLAWDHGKTRKPNNVSVDFTLRALGYERRIVRIDEGTATIIPAPRWRKA